MINRPKLLLLLFAIFVASSATVQAGLMTPAEAAKQAEIYQKWWEEPIEWKFAELPLTGIVPTERVPYSGHIYPDGWGGTVNALRKYDNAFYRGSMRATSWERQEIAATKEASGLFRIRRTPEWAGHCNGWTAAAIRHAEPQHSVRRRGVTFRPSDIKALLAELYTYQDVESLAGEGTNINPAVLHVLMTNWIGRQKQALGMDSSVGKEVWNYPIYSYRASAGRVRGRQVTVKMNLGYVHYLDEEVDEAPQELRFLSFHYKLYLNSAGEIIGGDYQRGSKQIDMLWAPKPPTQGGTEGNRGGNPYLNAREVLALWRASVKHETHVAWDAARPKRERTVVESTEEEQIAAAEAAQPPVVNTVESSATTEATDVAASTPSEPSEDEVVTVVVQDEEADSIEPTTPSVPAVAISNGPEAEESSTTQPESTPATTEVQQEPVEAAQPEATATKPRFAPHPDGFKLAEKKAQFRR